MGPRQYQSQEYAGVTKRTVDCPDHQKVEPIQRNISILDCIKTYKTDNRNSKLQKQRNKNR